jgi:hypothetical protein
MNMTTISFADQVTAAMKEIFTERGYPQIEATIAHTTERGWRFSVDTKGVEFSQEYMEAILQEAVTKVGGTYRTKED